MSAFERLVAAVIMVGVIVMPVIVLGATALKRDWPAFRGIVGGVLFTLALCAALFWWIRYLIGR